jgi:MinD-like ATPase involved in chromosome partitioning or flagellar assembly
MPIISIIGTKGGVGKSTVAMGVAAWLSKLQQGMVLLIDGDTHVRTVELKLCPGADVTLSHVLKGKNSLSDAIYGTQLMADGKPLFPRLAVLPAGGRFLPPGSRDMVKFVESTVKRFDKMLPNLRKKFAYIIVDTPASVGFEHLILTAIADKLLYVVNPDVDSILSTNQTAIGLKQLIGIEGIGVVVNRAPRGTTIDDWVDQAGRIAPVIGVVEDDELVDDAFRRDLPVVALYPQAPSSTAMNKIARDILKTDIPVMKLLPKFEFAKST